MRLRVAGEEDFGLGEVGDGGADAFAAEAGVFGAAVGEVVEAGGGDVVDDDAAHVEGGEGEAGLEEVAGEDAGVEAEGGVVDAGEDGGEV